MLGMITAADLPLLTLHPVADAQHRWVAILIDAPGENLPDRLLPAVEQWLASGLREALGKLPCILPTLPADAGYLAKVLDLSVAPGVLAGPSLLRVAFPADALSAQAALTALDTLLLPTQGAVRILHSGLAATSSLPASVQGQFAAGHSRLRRWY